MTVILGWGARRAGVAQSEFLDTHAGLGCPELWALPLFQVFRYSTTLEKHKLFISGLPFSCTKEELEDICKAHGTVKDLRLVTNRAGKPKVSGAQADFGSPLRSGPVRFFWYTFGFISQTPTHPHWRVGKCCGKKMPKDSDRLCSGLCLSDLSLGSHCFFFGASTERHREVFRASSQ